MKTIKINPKIRFQFVKNGIIFKINNYNTEKDASGIQVGGDEATKNITQVDYDEFAQLLLS